MNNYTDDNNNSRIWIRLQFEKSSNSTLELSRELLEYEKTLRNKIITSFNYDHSKYLTTSNLSKTNDNFTLTIKSS